MNTITKLRRVEELACQLSDLLTDLNQRDGYIAGYVKQESYDELIDLIQETSYSACMEADEREEQIAIYEKKIRKLKGTY